MHHLFAGLKVGRMEYCVVRVWVCCKVGWDASVFVCYFLRWNHERGSKAEQHSRAAAQPLPATRRTPVPTQDPDPPNHSASRLPDTRVPNPSSRTQGPPPKTPNSHVSSSASSPPPTRVPPHRCRTARVLRPRPHRLLPSCSTPRCATRHRLLAETTRRQEAQRQRTSRTYAELLDSRPATTHAGRDTPKWQQTD